MSSYSVTNTFTDFIPDTFDPTDKERIQRLGGNITYNAGKGTVQWIITDDTTANTCPSSQRSLRP